MMDKITYMDYLFYKVGKQFTDFEVQSQEQGGKMSKRRKFSEVGFEKKPFLNYVNARTLLINEVVLDLDQNKNESDNEFNTRVVETTKSVMNEFLCSGYTIFNSNNGVHIHIYINEMFFMVEKERIDLRKRLCYQFSADPLKSSEKVTIALEFATHFKSGKIKELIDSDLELFERGDQ
jgi:hypothetical protein